MREEIGFGGKCCLLPSAIVEGRVGCRLLAAEHRQEESLGGVAWSAPRGCRHSGCSQLSRVGKRTVSGRRGQCLRSAIEKKKRAVGVKERMSASHSAVKIHIENILSFDIPCL